MARGHEQTVASGAAEAEVGAAFGQRDEGDRLAGGIENLDPVLLGVAHAPAAPEIAVDIAAEAVGRATRFGGDEGATTDGGAVNPIAASGLTTVAFGE